MSRSRVQTNLALLEALGDSEAIEAAADQLPPSIASTSGQQQPKKKTPQKSEAPKPADPPALILQRYIAQERAKLGWIPERRRPDSREGPFPSEKPPLAGKLPQDGKYKVTLCTHWKSRGVCAYGDNCHFAHGNHELHPFRTSKEEAAAAGEEVEYNLPGYDENEIYPYSTTSAVGESSTSFYRDSGNEFGPSSAATDPTSMTPEQLNELYNSMWLSDDEDDDLPEAFLCPITQIRFRDPVVATDGYTYERSAIDAWLCSKETSPLTNLPLEDKVLYPNTTLMTAMRVCLGDHCFDD